MSHEEHREFRDDVIDRLARIEEGVKGVYPRLQELEAKVTSLEAWRLRVLGAGAAASAFCTYLGHDKIAALISQMVHLN